MKSDLDKMALLTLILSTALAVLGAYNNEVIAKQNTQKNLTCPVNHVPLPPIDPNEWWGPRNGTQEEDTTIKKFTIQFKKSMIKDLKSRLLNHQPLKPPLEGVAFNYGFNSTALEYWIQYMAKDYPIQEREKYLNQYPHFITNIQGMKIHYMRVTSKNKSHKLVPLMLLHGWPGSIREFYETIPYLLKIAGSKGIALDIIVPSLPGYGFSDGAVRPGMGCDKVATVMRNLMHRIGYTQYYVQGGGIGAVVASIIATFFPNEVLGYHTNYPLIHSPNMIFRLLMGNFHKEEITTPEFVDRLYPSHERFFDIMTMTGYLHMQCTKPDTVGIGLSDSAAGLMAYTMEKFSSWVRAKFINYPDGGLTEIFTADQLLDNYMIYWSTNSITTSMRLYAETVNYRFAGLRLNEIKTPVPTWVLQAPDELIYLPPWLIKKYKFPNLLGETIASEGGHFYAWEQPEPFAQDVVNAIVAFRDWHAINDDLYTQCSMYVDQCSI